MKKDRNSFFQSSNFNMSASSSPTLNMPMPYQNTMPNMQMPNIMANSSYYQSNMPLNYPVYADMAPVNMNEIDARMAKLERAINRLEARISKIEGTSFSNDTYNTDGNMYMV